MAISDDGRYAVVIQGVRLSLYDTLLDEVTPIGPRSGQVLAAAISPDGQTVAFWGTLESLNEIPEVEECRNPLSPYCGALFIYDVATGMTNTIPFGVRVGGMGGLQPGVSVANNGTIAVSADGIIHTGTFLIDREGELLSLSSEAIAVSLSSAGRYLAYITSEGVFVYDADIAASTQVTAESPGIVPFHEGATAAIDISDNGRFVVFVSENANFAGVPVEPCLDYIGRELPYCRHVYLIDRDLY